MALTSEQDERLTLILESLEPVLKELYPAARGFIEDQLKRHAQYKDDIRMSPKQWAWLEKLYKEFAPNAEVAAPPERDDAEDEPEDDMGGDTIPF